MKDAMTDHKAEWVLVPRVATEAMREAGRIAHHEAEERAPAEAGAGKAGMYLRANRAAHVYAAMLAAGPAASEGEDGAGVYWMRAEQLDGLKKKFHGGAVGLFVADVQTDLYSVPVYVGTRPAAQVAATPKHDEGRIAVCSNMGDSEANFIADGERLNCPACGGSGHIDDALATQPAARRVTDDPWVSELIAAAQGLADEQVYSDHDEPDYEPEDGKHNGPPAKARNKHQRAYWRLRAALESFAQPAEGVSGG